MARKRWGFSLPAPSCPRCAALQPLPRPLPRRGRNGPRLRLPQAGLGDLPPPRQGQQGQDILHDLAFDLEAARADDAPQRQRRWRRQAGLGHLGIGNPELVEGRLQGAIVESASCTAPETVRGRASSARTRAETAAASASLPIFLTCLPSSALAAASTHPLTDESSRPRFRAARAAVARYRR